MSEKQTIEAGNSLPPPLGSALQSTDKETRELRHENWELRVLLAIAHAGLSLYADDNELQDNRVEPFIDFKRDSVSEIERKLRERSFARAKKPNAHALAEERSDDSQQRVVGGKVTP